MIIIIKSIISIISYDGHGKVSTWCQNLWFNITICPLLQKSIETFSNKFVIELIVLSISSSKLHILGGHIFPPFNIKVTRQWQKITHKTNFYYIFLVQFLISLLHSHSFSSILYPPSAITPPFPIIKNTTYLKRLSLHIIDTNYT